MPADNKLFLRPRLGKRATVLDDKRLANKEAVMHRDLDIWTS